MEVPAIQALVSLQAEIYNHFDNCNIVFSHGFNAAKARTKLLKFAAEQTDVDYILNIDTDQVYDPKEMYALIDSLEEHKLEMLSAGYLIKDTTRFYAHGSYNPDGSYSKIHSDGTRGIIDCDVLGFGFLLMKHSFVKKMVDTYKDDLFVFDATNNSTEDVYFCRQAKKLGTKVCFDADIRVGHLMTVVQR